MKLVRLVLAVCLSLGVCTTALAANEDVSSIDSVTAGVADTGETKFGKTDKEITQSKGHYTVAVLPYVDLSGLEGRSREMAANAIKESLKKKYPSKKGATYKIASAKLVQKALKAYPMENQDSPVLDELVTLGKAMQADRVIYLSLLPVRTKESGFMVIAGTQTSASTITLKAKCVDVTEEKYLFNQNVEEVGSSSSINFLGIGEPSKAKGVKRGVENAMRDFLVAFE